ncbi:MAG: KH domain-containing protein [Clostridia bacterium]|nr:KH domain-containing protein [Clostridia bacterium]
MLDIIKYIVEQFAENKDEIEYVVNENGNTVEVTVILSDDDMGKVIGRQGKIAKALRTIVKAMAVKENKKYEIEIKEKSAINA